MPQRMRSIIINPNAPPNDNPCPSSFFAGVTVVVAVVTVVATGVVTGAMGGVPVPAIVAGIGRTVGLSRRLIVTSNTMIAIAIPATMSAVSISSSFFLGPFILLSKAQLVLYFHGLLYHKYKKKSIGR